MRKLVTARSVHVLAGAALGLALGGCQPPASADLILTGGKIAIVDDDFSIHETLVVRDGTVLAVGDASLADDYSAPTTIDLDGRLVVPGFNDTHTHISGNARRYIDLGGQHDQHTGAPQESRQLG